MLKLKEEYKDTTIHRGDIVFNSNTTNPNDYYKYAMLGFQDIFEVKSSENYNDLDNNKIIYYKGIPHGKDK